MELNKIEGLLEKYDKGATTLIEEAQLRDYFSQEIIPYHLESYKQLFSYFDLDAKQFLPTESESQNASTSSMVYGSLWLSQGPAMCPRVPGRPTPYQDGRRPQAR